MLKTIEYLAYSQLRRNSNKKEALTVYQFVQDNKHYKNI